MKKRFIPILLTMVLAGCGGGGGGGQTPPPSGSVEVAGNVYNTAPVAASAAAALVTGPAERLADVSKSEMIMVSTAVTNDTAAALAALSFEVQIEDASFLTPEHWTCQKKYNALDGSGGVYGFEVWTAYSTPLPVCSGEPRDAGFFCESYPAKLDCLNPFWAVDYTPPGDGLWKASGAIPGGLSAGQTWGPMKMGYGNSGIDIRPDHKARWIVKDDKGNTVASKEYLFNIIP